MEHVRGTRIAPKVVAALVVLSIAVAAGASSNPGPVRAGAGCHLLTTAVTSGSGTIDVQPESSGGCPASQYSTGYIVTLSTTPDPGYVWSGWTGTDDDSAPTTTATMNSDRHVTASFTENCYALTSSVSGGGGSIDVQPGSSGGCPSGQYSPGYIVTVSAVPSSGYVWESWTGTDNDSSATTTVTMNADRSIVATFTQNCYALTSSVSGGGGSISISPTSSGGCPSGQYSPGYIVTVSAVPSSGYVWESWTGTDNDSSATTTVTMNADRSIVATFSENCRTLSSSVAGSGGTISIMPTSAGGCGNLQYPTGYIVTVAAVPDAGYVWSYWSGTDNDSNATTTVTMSSDHSIVAGFSPNCYELTANVGAGNGTIAVTPLSNGGCPANHYTGGYVVFLSAEPAPGEVWTAWSGTDDDLHRATTVTMTTDKTVTAYFGSAGSTPPPTPTRTPTAQPTPTRTPTPAQTAAPTHSPTVTLTPPPGSTATFTPTPTHTLPAPTATPTLSGSAGGDVNCDGQTNAIDAQFLLQYSAGLLAALPCPAEADVFLDGAYNAIDAAVILQRAAGFF